MSEELTIEYRRLDEVAALRWGRNPKLHDLGALAESIRRHGLIDPPGWDRNLNGGYGGLLYGNGRDEALEWMHAQGEAPPRGVKVDTDGMWLIPVKVGVDQVSEEEAEAAALAHNNLVMAGGDFTAFDMARLWGDGYTDVLASLATSSSLPITVDGDALDGLLKAMIPEVVPGDGGDDFDATPADGPTRCKMGDLWAIGPHRLLVGDCTDPANVARLMQGERAALGFADPPYGAQVDEWDRAFVWNNDYLADLCEIVVVTPGISSIQEFMSMTKMPYQWSVSAWISNGFARGAIGFGNWMYGAVFSKGSIYRQAQDFLKIDLVTGQADGEYHRGQKPPKFMQWVIELFTKQGELIFDAFGGSGTTLVAAHRTGRSAYLMEIAPKYADVILRRAEAEHLECRLLTE